MVKKKYIRPQIDTSGLILRYKLYAGLTSTGKVFDYSLNGNDGTVTGSNISPAYPGFSFGGVDEIIDVGAPLQACFRGSFTIVVWVKLDDGQLGSQQVVLGLRDTSGAESRVDLTVHNTGDIVFRYGANAQLGTTAQTLNVAVPNGQTDWTQIAGVLDATLQGPGGKVIYVNGGLVDLDVGSDGSTLNVISSAFTADINLFIGAININDVASSFTAGLIDEPMIFNAAKTAAEMKSIFETQRWRYGI